MKGNKKFQREAQGQGVTARACGSSRAKRGRKRILSHQTSTIINFIFNSIHCRYITKNISPITDGKPRSSA